MTDLDAVFKHSSIGELDLLTRIAASLDVPREAFYHPNVEPNERFQLLDDTAELVRCFSQIGDRQVRQSCISFVKASVAEY